MAEQIGSVLGGDAVLQFVWQNARRHANALLPLKLILILNDTQTTDPGVFVAEGNSKSSELPDLLRC
jgi:hypothetical protein